MLSGLCLLLILLFLPETSRVIVGNGNTPRKHFNRPLFRLQHSSTKVDIDNRAQEQELPKRKCHIPNPIACFVLLFRKDTALVVLVNAVFYMTYGCVQASMSSLFIEIYGFSEQNAGFIYLPFGFGCAIASYLSGELILLFFVRLCVSFACTLSCI